MNAPFARRSTRGTPSIAGRPAPSKCFRDPLEQGRAREANGSRKRIEIAGAQRDHVGEVAAPGPDVMHERGNASRIGIFRRREPSEVDDDSRAARFERAEHIGEKPIRREPAQTRQLAEAIDGRDPFGSLVAAERGRLEASAREPTNAVEREVPLKPNASQLPPHRLLKLGPDHRPTIIGARRDRAHRRAPYPFCRADAALRPGGIRLHAGPTWVPAVRSAIRRWFDLAKPL